MKTVEQQIKMLKDMGVKADLCPTVVAWVAGENETFDFYSSKAYLSLFDHFCSDGEMPYGTMKGRDGDPYIWIMQRLEDLFEVSAPPKDL